MVGKYKICMVKRENIAASFQSSEGKTTFYNSGGDFKTQTWPCEP